MASAANSTTVRENQALPSLPALDISHLNGRELMAVYDAVHQVEEAALGVLNQPRCASREKREENYGPGGRVIETIMEWAGSARDAAVRQAEATTSDSKDDAEMCRWIAVKHHALCMGDLSDVAHRATAPLKVMRRSL